MVSDKIVIKGDGAGFEQALATAEAVAAYKGLSRKDTLHLCLLTEEMMGMLQGLTGEEQAIFFIEDEDNEFRLHLITDTAMDAEKRRRLIESSTSGKNSAAKGVIGKLRDLINQAFEPLNDDVSNYYSAGWVGYTPEPAGIDFSAYDSTWSFNQYRQSVDEEANEEAWDELEKSIVANLADEISIGINRNKVEMIIYKKI